MAKKFKGSDCSIQILIDVRGFIYDRALGGLGDDVTQGTRPRILRPMQVASNTPASTQRPYLTRHVKHQLQMRLR
jgi:hypothetical protein